MSTRDRPGRRQALTVEIEASPAYEFLMTLCTYNGVEHQSEFEVGKEWFDDIRKKASPDLLALVEHFSFHSLDIWEHLLGLVYNSPAPRDVPTFISYVEAMDPLELRLHLLGYYVREHCRVTSPEIIFQAAQGDIEAQKKLIKTSFPDDSEWQRTLLWLLSLEPGATKNLFVKIFHGWYDEVFRDQEAYIMSILRRDVEAKQALKLTHSAEQLIEIATGWEYVPEPGIKRIVLVPSYINRPWNSDAELNDTVIFCYPVAEESISADKNAPPARLVKLAKALADERRLRILKKLATGSFTLQELADDQGVAKTTVHHHMITLRSAGLVRMNLSDKRWSLRQYTVNNVGELLSTYLRDPSPGELP
ncbi:MAG TPA: ArsR family transcriptional regulator [Ktedonobacteraceae bacterium]|nr:ArsR family transcriptional regulator [Ktedonobacteraceae bacterium]